MTVYMTMLYSDNGFDLGTCGVPVNRARRRKPGRGGLCLRLADGCRDVLAKMRNDDFGGQPPRRSIFGVDHDINYGSMMSNGFLALGDFSRVSGMELELNGLTAFPTQHGGSRGSREAPEGDLDLEAPSGGSNTRIPGTPVARLDRQPSAPPIGSAVPKTPPLPGTAAPTTPPLTGTATPIPPSPTGTAAPDNSYTIHCGQIFRTSTGSTYAFWYLGGEAKSTRS